MYGNCHRLYTPSNMHCHRLYMDNFLQLSADRLDITGDLDSGEIVQLCFSYFASVFVIRMGTAGASMKVSD